MPPTPKPTSNSPAITSRASVTFDDMAQTVLQACQAYMRETSASSNPRPLQRDPPTAGQNVAFAERSPVDTAYDHAAALCAYIERTVAFMYPSLTCITVITAKKPAEARWTAKIYGKSVLENGRSYLNQIQFEPREGDSRCEALTNLLEALEEMLWKPWKDKPNNSSLANDRDHW